MPEVIIVPQWEFMVMSRWYGYTYEEALEAWKEKSGGKYAICVPLAEFNLIGTDKCTLYEQKHPVSEEQKREWIRDGFKAITQYE